MTKHISIHAFAMWKRSFFRAAYNEVDSEDWLFANEYIQVQLAQRRRNIIWNNATALAARLACNMLRRMG